MKRLLFALLLAPLLAHAQIKVNALPSASSVGSGDFTIDDQGGVTKKATFTQVDALIASLITTSPNTWSAVQTYSVAPVFSLAPSLVLGLAMADQTEPAAPASGHLNVYEVPSKAAAISQLIGKNSLGDIIAYGYERHLVVNNQTGSTITAGNAVYISGSTIGGIPTIAKARADSTSTMPAIGLTQYDIPTNTSGEIHVNGAMPANTTGGMLPGQAIYVSWTSAGAFSTTKPPATNVVQQVGTVLVGNSAYPTGQVYFSAGSIVPAIMAATTGSIGGGALAAGACASGTATVTGALATMGVYASPTTYPGDGNYWAAYVSAADTVTVKVCAAVAGTPGASTYTVRVIQ